VTAHRVGVLGALIAVAVLSLELAGAVAWKHHAVANQPARWESPRGTALMPALDSTLEDVTVQR
jgi:hypothetical protein